MAKIFFPAEDMETVDSSLTPDPFTSVTKAGTNAVAQVAGTGEGGTNGMDIIFGGGAVGAFGLKTFSALAKLINGPIEFNLSFNVTTMIIAAGFFVSLMNMRTGATDLIQLRWIMEPSLTAGKLQIYDVVGATGVTGVTAFSIGTYVRVRVTLNRAGSCKVFINGSTVTECSINIASPPTTIQSVRVGTAAASVSPLAGSEIRYDNVRVQQIQNITGGILVFFDLDDARTNLFGLGIVAGGECVGIF